MKVIQAVRKYLNTDREIFVRGGIDNTLRYIDKEKDFKMSYGSEIGNLTVKCIDEDECPCAVTIYV